MPFALKNFISHLLSPGPAILCVLLLGCALLVGRRTRRAGRAALVGGALLFLAFGFGVLNGALERLERTYPPFPGDDADFCESLRGATVAVLGNGLAPVDLPARFCDNDCFRRRISEGAFVAHKIPGSQLAVSISGDAPSSQKSVAAQDIATTYGFETNRVAFFGDARDTVEEARTTLRMAGSNRVVVVTSASHMPRAIRIFKSLGCDPVPAPCEYVFFGPNARWAWYDWHFGTRNFDRAERLMHESFGLLYEKVRK